MASCERCWADAGSQAFFSAGDQADIYRRLADERQCTPEQQAGPGATVCTECSRHAVHQFARVCMACGADYSNQDMDIQRLAIALKSPNRLLQDSDGRRLPPALESLRIRHGVTAHDAAVLVRFLAGDSLRALKHDFQAPESTLRSALKFDFFKPFINELMESNEVPEPERDRANDRL